MLTPVLEFSLLGFVSLFTMINPLGVAPIYVTMTSHLGPVEARRVAVKATLTAFFILAFFALTGQFVFRFFSISIDSLRIVGCVLFFGMGAEMLQARLTRTQHGDEAVTEYVNDVSITPLGIPMICGPGAITTVILLMSSSPDMAHRIALFVVMVAVLLITVLMMLGAKRVLGVLGSSGNKVMMRLMGLIVMVIAVEFFFAGLTPFVRRMLHP